MLGHQGYFSQTRPPQAPPNTNLSLLDDNVNRLVYKLVRVGEDGTVSPATEDEVMQVDSLVEGDSGLEPWVGDVDVDVAEAEEGDEIIGEDEEDSYPGYVEGETASVVGESEVERRKLHSQLEVLDLILEKISDEEQRRLNLEMGCKEENKFISYNSGEFKRRRRPNPKYFSPVASSKPGAGVALHHEHVSYCGDFIAESSQIVKQQSQTLAVNGAHARASRTFDKKYDKTTDRFEIPEKSLLSTPSNTDSSAVLENNVSLEALSIRELHEAFYRTFGRETSVKDKHWLKRQIYMGLKRYNEFSSNTSGMKDNTAGTLQEFSTMVRLDDDCTAEQSLSSYGGILIRGRRTNMDEPFEAANGAKLLGGLTIAGLSSKQPHQEVLPLVESPPTSSSPVDASMPHDTFRHERAGSVHGGVLELPNSEHTGGKRLRKPNRKYIEDGDDEFDSGGNGTRHAMNTIDSGQGEMSLKSGSKLSCRNSCDGPAELSTQGFIEVSGIVTPQSHGRRRKNSINVSVHDTQISKKQKSESRVTKLVKVSESSFALRDDSDCNFRKVKFRLPTSPDSEVEGTVLQESPLVSDEISSDRLSTEEDSLDEFEEQIARVPTANGGTRRKHHRPWTLREVLTLVEGVAQCGGGKWADIKKSSFSAVGYRTAVDLKDKWRNLLRASRVQVLTNKQGENRKKNISAMIPALILARVRELADLQNQAQTASVAGCTSRSGRLVHRK